jgi:predicted RNA binding protein YcfA (HicA-like mRNA interferase family)
MKVPSLNYDHVLRALQRDGWVVVSQKGSHIKLRKRTQDGFWQVIVPAHKPIKRSTLAHVIKDAHLTLEAFLDLL